MAKRETEKGQGGKADRNGSGMSRLYWPPAFLLTVFLAVAPVPLAVLFLGRPTVF